MNAETLYDLVKDLPAEAKPEGVFYEYGTTDDECDEPMWLCKLPDIAVEEPVEEAEAWKGDEPAILAGESLLPVPLVMLAYMGSMLHYLDCESRGYSYTLHPPERSGRTDYRVKHLVGDESAAPNRFESLVKECLAAARRAR